MSSYLASAVSLLRGEDPMEVEGTIYDQDGNDLLMSDGTGDSREVPLRGRWIVPAYAFGAVGLLLTIFVALALPTFHPSCLGCPRHLNFLKLLLSLPGLLMAFTGLLLGSYQTSN